MWYYCDIKSTWHTGVWIIVIGRIKLELSKVFRSTLHVHVYVYSHRQVQGEAPSPHLFFWAKLLTGISNVVPVIFLFTMFCNCLFELLLSIFWFFLKQIVLKSDFVLKKTQSNMEMSGAASNSVWVMWSNMFNVYNLIIIFITYNKKSNVWIINVIWRLYAFHKWRSMGLCIGFFRCRFKLKAYALYYIQTWFFSALKRNSVFFIPDFTVFTVTIPFL